MGGAAVTRSLRSSIAFSSTNAYANNAAVTLFFLFVGDAPRMYGCATAAGCRGRIALCIGLFIFCFRMFFGYIGIVGIHNDRSPCVRTVGSTPEIFENLTEALFLSDI